MMYFQYAVVAWLATTVAANWNGNLNYRSPSLRHPSLGLDMAKIQKRNVRRDMIDATQLNFTHGVASGDPYPNSIILWTRVAPIGVGNDDSNITVEGTVPLYSHDTEEYVIAAGRPICVNYVISPNKDLSDAVDSGTAYTSSDIDYTIKVEALNLSPFQVYYYQFTICNSNKQSPIGRTKTTPNADDDVSNVGLAVYSCSNYPNGYFNAYGNAARKDKVDFFVHLGDYIYEGGVGVLGKDPRATNPGRETFTLFDYRTRIGQYRTDSDLLLAHQNFAWITVWDDHEVSNNGYRDGSSGLNNTEDSFIKDGGVSVDQRKMNAVRAYFEWLPIRQVDMDDNLRIWRTFSIGNLFDLIMLDTRNYDRSITTLDWNNDYVLDISNDAGRTMMGSHQENWFYNQLSQSAKRGAAWRVIGNQVVFSRINITSWFGTFENPYNGDQWDGYMANRNRTLQHLYNNNIGNNIMLAGDSHANWVSDLVWLDEEKYDGSTGIGAIGVEFAGTAVSSSGFGGTIPSANLQASTLVRDNSELQWNEGWYRGYFELHLTHDQATANYYGCATVASRNPYEISLGNFTIQSGANHVQRPVGDGLVQAGFLRDGKVELTNLTLDTETGKYLFINFSQNFIQYND